MKVPPKCMRTAEN